MTNIKNRIHNHAALIILLGAATFLFTCEKVPDYCGKGEWYDPSVQFCFVSKAYNLCGGSEYNPLTQGCYMGKEVGTKCLNGSVAQTGTPCAGYTLTPAATPAAGGSVTRTPNKDYYAAGETVVVAALPADGYKFIGWAGASSSAERTEIVTMDANKPIAAMFKPLSAPGTLITTAFPENGGEITRDPNMAVYDTTKKTSVTVTAKANPGYTFDVWSGDASSKDPAIKITMNDSKTLVAVFKPNVYTLTARATPSDGGAVFINGTALYKPVPQDFGTEIEAIAVAADGYCFSEWSGAATGSDNPTTFRVTDGDMTLAATFKQCDNSASQRQLYLLTIVIGATGASIIGGAYAEGTTVTVSAGKASNGLAFKNWTTASNGVNFADAKSATTTFRMPGYAVTVTAVFGEATGSFTDSRDGKQYKSVVIGGQNWMAENLNYQTASGSWCYDNDPANCNMYGRLYDWATAMSLPAYCNENSCANQISLKHKGICPSGWHIPNNGEWQTLVDFAGGDDVAGSRLKATNGWNSYIDISSTDQYGFSALPGSGHNSDGSIDDAGYAGYWWTATENSNGYFAYFRYMFFSVDFVNDDYYDKSDGYSLRCLAD